METDSDKKFYNLSEVNYPPELSKSKKSNRERCCWILLVLILIGAVVGVTVYFTQKDDGGTSGNSDTQKGTGATTTTATTSTNNVPREELESRINCIPEAEGGVTMVTKELCEDRRCVYEPTSVPGIPHCYYSKQQGYRVESWETTSLGYRAYLSMKSDGPFGDDIESVIFDVEMRDNETIRFKFDDSLFNRYKVPLDVNVLNDKKATGPKYIFKVTNNETFAFQIIRKSTGKVLWDTGVGGLVLSNQFLQISTKLPSTYVYGFGENLHRSFKHDLNHKTWPMFSRDQGPSFTDYANLYGVHPFYTCQEGDGNSHGVFLLNSNAMEYSFTPLPMLTYTTIGGILDFYMFLGPDPETVVQQYTNAIGRPFMPPYWALGFQICRYGYKNTKEIETVVQRTKQFNIPHDVQYADIDHFNKLKDFTLDTENFGDLPEYFNQLRKDGMHTVIILDPALQSDVSNYEPYDNITNVKGSIMWPKDYKVSDDDQDSTGALLGYVWPPGKAVFPDFFNPDTGDVWSKLIVKHKNIVPFDALWIDMNEPANFGTNEEVPWNWPEDVKPRWSLKCPINNKLEDPPYRTKASYLYDNATSGIQGRLSDKTICMISRQGKYGQYKHYDVHSLYGWSETYPTFRGVQAATGQRSFVLSRSTYPGSGKYTGHWLGDNNADWSDLQASIIGMLEFNLFGIPYVGADICGYWGNNVPELCMRWLQLGAFYPFSRNHNQYDAKDNDPGHFGGLVAVAAREALQTRYWLLPYLYTLFYKAHTEGTTVVRPLFHEFKMDETAYTIDKQFLWGQALMIVPILEQGQLEVSTYYPADRWYDFYNGDIIESTGMSQVREVNISSKIGLYVRGGNILPMQKPANNTSFSRKNPFKLLIALDESSTATGDLYWDDGNSINTTETGNYFYSTFKSEKNSLTMRIQHDNTPDLHSLYLDTIQVYGAPLNIQRVYYDNEDLKFKSQGNVLTIECPNITFTKDFTVYWSSEIEDERLRHDCFPEVYGGYETLNQESCASRGCIYNETVTQGPSCYMNIDNYGYRLVSSNETDLGHIYHLQHKGRPNPYQALGSPDIIHVSLTVEYRGNDLLRFKFEDLLSSRYQVPVSTNLNPNQGIYQRAEFKVISQDPFAFQIIRKSNNEILWDTSVGGFTFSNQFIQISTKLPSKYIYGFGENVHTSYRHDINYRRWPLFSRDQPTGWADNVNHYGVHPFYMCKEKYETGGNTHGVLLLNSNSQEYSFTPLPMLTYTTIGGILDFYMFLGPEPETVVQQYTNVIGRPYMPPYWSLGFQLCRYGYNSIENLKDAVERTKDAGIPHDVQYADIDHMKDQMDFTIDDVKFNGLDDYFKSLQSQGMKIIIILDPTLITTVENYVPYIRMVDTGSAIKWSSNESIPAKSSDEFGNLLGYVWPPGKVIFPDFFKNSTKEVWEELIVNHHKSELTFDGLWIDMNEPANFGTNEKIPWNWPKNSTEEWSLNCSLPGNTYEHPPYRTMAAYAYDGGRKINMISDKTICMRAVQGDGGIYKHYDVHSLYGWSQTEPTLDALRAATSKRGMVISRSTFPSSGKHAGHWLGDNTSEWPDLKYSIIGSLEFNLFGIPYIGADICGFFSDTNPELCKRWMQLGAFYTFSRNHNGLGYKRQDPGSLGHDVAEASRIAMETRYWLLPYLYTLFVESHMTGATVMRPLHHEFPEDMITLDIDKQFLWGPALMISPILNEGQTSIDIYIPRGPWYDFYNGHEVTGQNDYITLPVEPDTKIPLHVRAGYILPLQTPANNTHFSRQNPFTLLVSLKDSENSGRGYVSHGDLYWDDGDSIDTFENGKYYHVKFTSGHDTLWSSIEVNHADSGIDGLYIDTIKVYGVRTNVNVIYTTDKVQHTGGFSYNVESKVLVINNLNLSLNEEFTINWREYRHPTEEEMLRSDCMPGVENHNVTQTQCKSRGCMYDNTDSLPFVPVCYIDRALHGYRRVVQTTSSDIDIELNKRTQSTLFDKFTANLKVSIEKASDSVVHIKITEKRDDNVERYEVPIDINVPNKGYKDDTSLYDVKYTDDTNAEFSIQVIRKSTNTTIWDTSAGPLIFSDQFLQISSKLSSDNFYGLGEHRHFHLKHNMDYKTWPIFSRDAAFNSQDYTNLYGAHPFYMNVEDEDGHTNAVLFLNSNAMEVVLEPLPRVTYRTIGGILEFYIFIGPDPETVIQQYTQSIGKPAMIPYWSLGFQLCRWGYHNLTELKAAVDRTKDAGIPHDVQYADIDYMDEYRDFTINNEKFGGLPQYVNELQDGGMHFIVITDVGIPINYPDYYTYTSGEEKDVFIKWPNNTGPLDSRPSPDSDILLGYVWPKQKTAFPDFFNERTKEWWIDNIRRFHAELNFDGLWIDMNEPANFDTNGVRPWNYPENRPDWSLKCLLDNNTWDNPPYVPSILDGVLSTKTLCMQALQKDGKYRHYDVHSLYGWSEAIPTLSGIRNATNKRGLVVSRSTYPSSGHYTMSWLGDNDSFWRNLHDSIIGIIEYNLFGIPMIGADICGFFAHTTPELCQRWMQLGAFYTFSRNHNGLNMKDQDPGVFNEDIQSSSRRAMEIRYSLLPFLYTQFYRVHLQGGTVIRSMMHVFPTDKKTYNIDTQFMWADSLLIAPVLEQGHVHKDIYFPDARWFDYYTGEEMSKKRTVRVNAPRDHIPLYLKGGSIIPTQEPANNTVYSRRNSLGFLIVPDDNGTASGQLFWDDGDSIETIEKNQYFLADITYENNLLRFTPAQDHGPVDNLKIDEVWVYGVSTKPTSLPLGFVYYSDTKLLHVKGLNKSLHDPFVQSFS
ncbi:hypothetical protein ACF0H5_005579 [Mactra antiquata]